MNVTNKLENKKKYQNTFLCETVWKMYLLPWACMAGRRKGIEETLEKFFYTTIFELFEK